MQRSVNKSRAQAEKLTLTILQDRRTLNVLFSKESLEASANILQSPSEEATITLRTNWQRGGNKSENIIVALLDESTSPW